MKTRINVVVRVRPLLEHEISQEDSTDLLNIDEDNGVIRYL